MATDRIHAQDSAAQLCCRRFAAPLLGRLGPWQLVRLLGEGNFTRVYQARPADGPTIRRRHRDASARGVRREGASQRVVARVRRPSKCSAARLGRRQGVASESAARAFGERQEPPFYVVTPKLDGVPLAQLIAEQERLAVPLALWIARQVAEGLDALFEATGMIHSDVKPANILVSPTGHATLIDFGFVQTPAEASHWATRPLAGTLAYIAPEMVTSALAAGPRSDIYSLGVTLYEMLSGRRPWDSDDPGELATLHREAKPADVRALRPDVPAPVAELVHSMLAKDPLRRPGQRARTGDAAGAAGNRLLLSAMICG